MSFRKAVEETPTLEGAFQKGLQALRAQDRERVSPQDTRRLEGSVDIDSATQGTDPQGNRWDFAIAYRHTDRTAEVVYWAEFHTASDSEVKVVLRKVSWLLSWLENDGKKLKRFERDIIWVASGRTAFTLSAPQRKQMAANGLQYRGSMLRILNRRD